MKKYQFLPAILLSAMLGLGLLPSCTYDPSEPPVVEDTTTVRFKANASATYREYQLDTTGGSQGGTDKEIQSTETMDTATVTDTAATHQGKSKVIVISHTDTIFTQQKTYYAQDTSGMLYNYNFGVAFINNVAILRSFIVGGKAEIGWVKLGSTKAAVGTKWGDSLGVVKLTGVPLFGDIDILIRDTAFVAADSTFLVGSESITAKHFVHDISLRDMKTGSLATGSSRVEVFVAPKLGLIVREISRMATVSTALTGSMHLNGYSRQMISHSN
jgi:hypothetical protein